MSPERRGPEPPRTDTTLFPDTEIQKSIADAGPSFLADALRERPPMTAPLLHELWRNNRSYEMYVVVEQEQTIPPLAELIDNITDSTAFMHARLGEPLGKCESFVEETLTTVSKVIQGVPYDDSLDEETTASTKELTKSIIEECSRLYRVVNN